MFFESISIIVSSANNSTPSLLAVPTLPPTIHRLDLPATRVIFSHAKTRHVQDAEPNYVIFQRAAVSAGLAWFDPVSHLLVHPAHGSWLALRALVIFDDVAVDAGAQAPSVPCPLSDEQRGVVAAAVERAIEVSSRGQGAGAVDHEAVRFVWRLWVESREALTPGEVSVGAGSAVGSRAVQAAVLGGGSGCFGPASLDARVHCSQNCSARWAVL